MGKYDIFLSLLNSIDPHTTPFDYFMDKLKNEHTEIYFTFIAILDKLRDYSQNDMRFMELYSKNFQHQHIFRCPKCQCFNNVNTKKIVKNFLIGLDQKLNTDVMIDRHREQRTFDNLAEKFQKLTFQDEKMEVDLPKADSQMDTSSEPPKVFVRENRVDKSVFWRTDWKRKPRFNFHCF